MIDSDRGSEEQAGVRDTVWFNMGECHYHLVGGTGAGEQAGLLPTEWMVHFIMLCILNTVCSGYTIICPLKLHLSSCWLKYYLCELAFTCVLKEVAYLTFGLIYKTVFFGAFPIACACLMIGSSIFPSPILWFIYTYISFVYISSNYALHKSIYIHNIYVTVIFIFFSLVCFCTNIFYNEQTQLL